MKDFILKDLNDIVDTVRRKENIYRELDFNRDIDPKKSDCYLLSDNGEISFMYTQNYDLLNYRGHFFDNLNKDEEKDKLIINYNKSYLSEPYESMIYTPNYTLDNDDFLCFNLPNYLDEFDWLAIDISDASSPVASPSKIFRVAIYRNFVYVGLILVSDTYKSKYIFNHNFKINKDIKKLECMLDVKLDRGFIDGKKIYTHNMNKLGFRENLKYIFVKYSKMNYNISSICIYPNSLLVGKGSVGYIYIYPIELIDVKKISVKMIYKGHVRLEIYDYRYNKWVTISEKNILDNLQNKLLMRINLNRYDKLFKIFIINKDMEK